MKKISVAGLLALTMLLGAGESLMAQFRIDTTVAAIRAAIGG